MFGRSDEVVAGAPFGVWAADQGRRARCRATILRELALRLVGRSSVLCVGAPLSGAAVRRSSTTVGETVARVNGLDHHHDLGVRGRIPAEDGGESGEGPDRWRSG